MKFIALLMILTSFQAYPCDGGMKLRQSYKSFIPANSKFANDMTEQEFKSSIKHFEKFFGPDIEREHNSELIVYGSWASNTVNAYAEKSDKKVMVTIYGGLARHKAITKDGFMAVLCHELGHHFGGYPKKSTNKWSSAEGQADYYASMKCLRRLWKSEDNALALSGVLVPEIVKKECAQTFPSTSEQLLCQRMSLAGRSIALMIQDLDHDSIEPKFETPEPHVVRAMNYLHPFAQCRLDTYFQGSICHVPENQEFDNSEEKEGSCHPKLGDSRGNRPRCWFVPRL
jgi:hypothetical protein